LARRKKDPLEGVMTDLVGIVNKAEALLSVISSGKREIAPRYGLIVSDDEIHIAVPRGAHKVRTYSNVVEIEYPPDKVMRIPLPMSVTGWHIKAYNVQNTLRVDISRYVKVPEGAVQSGQTVPKKIQPEGQTKKVKRIKKKKPEKVDKKEEPEKEGEQ